MQNQKEGLEPISLRLYPSTVENIKQLSRFLSYKLSRDISYVDLIRDLVEEEFQARPMGSGDEQENRLLARYKNREIPQKKYCASNPKS